MTVSGLLSECLFEIVDGSCQRQIAEFAASRAGEDCKTEPTLNGRKGGLGHPALAV